MYSPKYFIEKDLNKICDFIKENPLGIIITTNNKSELSISHIPFQIKLEHDTLILEAHIANENLQKNEIINDSNCTVIFQGPNTYISSGIYNHENVSTWNYQAVHVYGSFEILTNIELLNHLEELTNFHEEKRKNPHFYKDLNQKLVKSLSDKITGFRVISKKIEAVFKLSQNRNKSDYQAIVNDLENNIDKQANIVASVMKKNMK